MTRLWIAALATLAVLALAGPAALSAPPKVAKPVHDGSTLTLLSPKSYPDPDVLSTPGGLRIFGTGGGIPSVQINADGTVGGRAPSLEKPKWAASKPELWAPDVWQSAGPVPYVMYFTAKNAATGHHCVGVATAGAPEGPYTVTNRKRPTWCSEDPTHQVIDPTYVLDGSQPYMVFKDNVGNKSDFTIRALPMDPSGVSRVSGAKPVILQGLPTTERMENPAFTYHNGVWWLFLSRGGFRSCGYYTDARPSAGLLGPYGAPKKVTSRKLTRATTPGGLCGPGGASLNQEGANTRITLHAFENGVPGNGKPRLPWTAFLSWNKKGKPFID